MNRKNINFDNKNIKKSDFYNKNKKIFSIDDIDVNKVLVSKKDNMANIIDLNILLVIMIMMLFIRPLYLKLSQMTGYINKFEKKKKMSLMVKDKQFLKKCNKIWKKN